MVLDDLRLTKEYIQASAVFFIVACGSSYHVGMVGKYNWERLPAARWRCVWPRNSLLRPVGGRDHSLVIFISQSGETLDTMAALREAKRRGGRTLAVVNVVAPSIAREADDVLYTWAGPEIAVATTKAYFHSAGPDGPHCPVSRAICWVPLRKRSTIPSFTSWKSLPEKLRTGAGSIEDVKYFASRYFQPRFHLLHRPESGLRHGV